MLIDIEVAAFVGGPRNLKDLLVLMGMFADGRHQWMPSDHATLAAAHSYFREHAPTIADSTIVLAEKALVATVWQPGQASMPLQINDADVRDATEDLSKAAVLVVEDLTNDGHFIRALAKIFEKEAILSALERKWLVIRHSGGERLEIVARADRENFSNIVRVFALLDSDKLTPEQQTKSHKKAQRLAELGIKVHVLEMREAENYVPNQILALCGASRTKSSRKITHLKKLTKEQRAYFDMKHGFGPEDQPARIHEKQIDLYLGLSEQTKNALCGGFGNSILKTFNEHSRTISSKVYDGMTINSVKEVKELLSAIQSIL
ncbi:hypothetical protein OG943_02705 [Amycolatopsis sp. NBC_00345]|uniref:hypothetical protein n=1 Tax=Amycolatopsis sp. NBC_00345 TaxID=2975955 RepID=UPI002E26EFE9